MDFYLGNCRYSVVSAKDVVNPCKYIVGGEQKANSLSTGWNSLQMSVKCRVSMVVAGKVGLDSSGDLLERSRVDLSSIGCITALKSPPTIWWIWGNLKSLVNSSP